MTRCQPDSKRHRLERAGYDVKLTGSGAKALENWRDVQTGCDSAGCRLARHFGPGRLHVDIELEHGLHPHGQRSSLRARRLARVGLGADDYITKPFSGNELVARVASFLRRREKIPQQTRIRQHLAGRYGQLNRENSYANQQRQHVIVDGLRVSLAVVLGERRGSSVDAGRFSRSLDDTSACRLAWSTSHVAAFARSWAKLKAPMEIASVRGIGYRPRHQVGGDSDRPAGVSGPPPQRSSPLYVALADQLVEAIESGRLGPGARLPRCVHWPPNGLRAGYRFASIRTVVCTRSRDRASGKGTYVAAPPDTDPSSRTGAGNPTSAGFGRAQRLEGVMEQLTRGDHRGLDQLGDRTIPRPNVPLHDFGRAFQRTLSRRSPRSDAVSLVDR